jgi:hypothetical protein
LKHKWHKCSSVSLVMARLQVTRPPDVQSRTADEG